MTVKLYLFASARDLAGTDCLNVDLPDGATVADLKRALEWRAPGAAGLLNRCAIARNHEYAEDDEKVTAADELALIPPVSGG